MKSPNPASTIAMRNAWRLAREGWRIYGGSPRTYIREALRIAWAELKAHPVFQACQELIGRLEAERRQPHPVVSLSLELRAAAARWSCRHGARAYGGGLGSAKFTAGW